MARDSALPPELTLSLPVGQRRSSLLNGCGDPAPHGTAYRV